LKAYAKDFQVFLSYFRTFQGNSAGNTLKPLYANKSSSSDPSNADAMKKVLQCLNK